MGAMDEPALAAHRADDVCLMAASLAGTPDGIECAYQVLENVAARHDLEDAHLVLRPRELGPQIFRLSRQAVAPERVAELLSRPTSLVAEPDVVDPATGAALAGICNAAFAAGVARLRAAVDTESGLAARPVIEAALARAAARSSRHGWACTAVLLTTAGDGSPADRWTALCLALRSALRSGDEAGVVEGGRVLAILGAAGSDVVRPFVARIRAELTEAGADGIDLVAATASAPHETVDPSELWALATERLDELSGPATGDPATGGPSSGPSGLELELRATPGVVGVGVSPGDGVTVVVDGDPDRLSEILVSRIRARRSGAAVRVVAGQPGPSTIVPAPGSPVPGSPVAGSPVPGGAATPAFPVNGHLNGINDAPPAPPQLSATAPRAERAEDRVSLLSATFDPDIGMSEVRLGRGNARGTGRASAGPLAGGAQATLTALAGLGTPIPFYLVSAERAHGVPGEPVVVVLAPRRVPGETPGPAPGERIGVAGGSDDIEAAGRATLGALNRFLARAEWKVQDG
jgi:hypothetical protein